MLHGVDASFETLPTEILLLIIKHLEPTSIINLAFAAYSELQARRIVPPMTWSVYTRVCRDMKLALPLRGPVPIFSAWPLPTELTLKVLSKLQPHHLIKFVLAHKNLVPGLIPEITPDTDRQLTKAWSELDMGTDEPLM